MWPVAVRSYFRSRGEMPGACDKRNLTAFRDYERALFTNFRREALLLAEYMPHDDWQWLALAPALRLADPAARLVGQPAGRALFRRVARHG